MSQLLRCGSAFCKILGAADFARSSAVRLLGIFSNPSQGLLPRRKLGPRKLPHPKPRTSASRKQVRIIAIGAGSGKSAYDLMIPKDWQFKGWVNVGVAEGGCF